MADTVFLMKNDGNLMEIGAITDNNVQVNKIGIKPVDNFNEQILYFIKNDDDVSTDVMHIITSGDIFGIVFHIMRWRRCTGFLVIQHSVKGNRYLCYLYDKVKHWGTSFATTPNLVKIEEVKQEFINAKKILAEHIKQCTVLLSDYDIDDSFGV